MMAPMTTPLADSALSLRDRLRLERGEALSAAAIRENLIAMLDIVAEVAQRLEALEDFHAQLSGVLARKDSWGVSQDEDASADPEAAS